MKNTALTFSTYHFEMNKFECFVHWKGIGESPVSDVAIYFHAMSSYVWIASHQRICPLVLYEKCFRRDLINSNKQPLADYILVMGCAIYAYSQIFGINTYYYSVLKLEDLETFTGYSDCCIWNVDIFYTKLSDMLEWELSTSKWQTLVICLHLHPSAH